MAKKVKVEKKYQASKTSQTFEVTKKQFDMWNDDKLEYLIENNPLSLKLGKATIKYKSQSRKVNVSWFKWDTFDEVWKSQAEGAGFKNKKELKKHLKKEKSGLRSNSPLTLIKIV